MPTSPRLDAAVGRALGLDASSISKTKVASHGGSGFSSTAKISCPQGDGSEKHYFMKTGPGAEKAVMFEGEHASLNAIHAAVPSLCPASLGFGPLQDVPGAYFLVTAFLDFGSGSGSGGAGSGLSLAQKLARLHTTPAPTPAGRAQPAYGFPAVTCCGDTPQPNGFTDSWADFYAQNRLMAILRRSEQNNGRDADLRGLVEQTVKGVVPRLLGDDNLNDGKKVMPVVCHGDLWSGNKGRAVLDGASEDVVYDPSAVHGHSEYDLGIMGMFGGFSSSFYREYHNICPKTEPVKEYEDRVKLYELYHHLNHHAIFGGGYRSGAVSIMRRLIKLYGGA